MVLPDGFVARRVLAMGFMALTAAGSVMAQDAPPSLGQHWPKASNASKDPAWKVYVFVHDGIKYIQVNDNAGNPRTTIATANGQVLPIPLGSDWSRTRVGPVGERPGSPSADGGAQTIYDDGTISISAHPVDAQTATFSASAAACNAGCSHFNGAIAQ